MEIVQQDGVFFVSGDITEDCELATAKLPTGPVTFDLGGVRTINSCGVREWITWIEKLGVNPIYQNCPQAVVMQFNMVSEFLENNAKVLSFRVPAYCEACGKKVEFTLKKDEHYTAGETLEDFELPQCENAQCEIEPEVDFDSYFYFIEELVD